MIYKNQVFRVFIFFMLYIFLLGIFSIQVKFKDGLYINFKSWPQYLYEKIK